jgi:hypothetical protein
MIENLQFATRSHIDLAIAILADVDVDAAKRNYSSYSSSTVDFHHPAFGNYLAVPLYHNPEELDDNDSGYLLPFKWGQYIMSSDLLPNSCYNSKANHLKQSLEASEVIERLLFEGVATEIILRVMGVAEMLLPKPGLLLHSTEQQGHLHWGKVVRQAVGG